MLEPPPPAEFPGTGDDGNGISNRLQVQGQWLDISKQGCQLCHQLGTKITRELHDPKMFDSSLEAWDHRVQTGQRGMQMNLRMNQFGRARGLKMWADWTDRIAAGQIPAEAPRRPEGVERNLVLTLWDWGTEVDYVHDEVASDKRDPTVNANGPIYGVAISNDLLTITDPVAHTSTELKIPTRDAPSTIPPMISPKVLEPSYYYGDEVIWEDPANPHNPMMDHKRRVWMTSQIRGRKTPAFCQEGSDHPSAQYYPLDSSGRGIAVYDPETEQFELIDTCYGTHHLQFAEDDDDTLWFSGGGDVIGWINVRVWTRPRTSRRPRAGARTVLDTNGDGKITEWVEPRDPADPTLDTRVVARSYGIVPNPVDGSIWIASTQYPGRLARLDPGSNPPETCVTELYEVPSPLDPHIDEDDYGFSPRGIDVDRNGLIWTALSGSSHMASFDRTKCSVLNGPQATGRHCPEGWTLYPTPEVEMQGVEGSVRADYHYYSWVDQWDTLGLGKDIPIAAGSNSDSLLALMPDTKEWVILRVPYPMGFFTRGLDGRIDDPDAGWKGRGVWATYGAAVTWHIEGGKGTRPSIIRFQMRPDPLAN